MKFQSNAALRTRVILVIFTIFGLLIAIYFLLLRPFLHRQISVLEEDKLNIYAMSVASDLNLDRDAAIRELENAAELSAIRQMEPQQLAQTLAFLDEVSSFSQAFTVLDSTGEILARPSQPEQVGESRVDQEYFMQAIQNGRTFISPMHNSTTDDFNLTLSTPIYGEDGVLKGVLTSSLGVADRNPDMYNAVLNPEIPPDWEVFPVSDRGILLTHSNKIETNEDLEDADYTAHPLVEMALRKQWGTQEIVVDGQSWHGASALIPILNWTVVVQAPSALVLQSVNHITGLFTATVLTLVVVLLLVGLLLAKRYMISIEMLTNALRDYGNDGVATPLILSGNSPLAPAVNAFNQMVAERGKSIAQLDYQAMLLQQNVSDAVISTDMNYRVLSWNPAAELLFGWSSDEVVGKFVADILQTSYPSPITPEGVQAEFERTGHWVGEVIQHHRDGSVIYIYSMIRQLLDASGTMIGLLAVNRDITERKRAEEVLQKTEERFRQLFEQAAIGLAFITIEGKWALVNGRLCQMLGYSEQELLGTPPSDITYPEDQNINGSAVERLLSGKTTSEEFEKRYIHKNGAIVWAHVTISILQNRDELPEFTIAAIRDISEHKELENQFLQSQKMEAIGRLAGGVAHDFNNLLTIIMSYSDLTVRRRDEPEAIEKYIGHIRSAAEQASLLTKQLLAFSRKQMTAPKVLNINDVIEKQIPLLRRLLPENLDIISQLSPDLGRAYLDKGNLEQLLLNLLVNARDAMPEGGHVGIETNNAYLDEMYTKNHSNVEPGNYAMLAISDNGVGMDTATMGHIFEPFFTTKEIGEGTGLGLSTVYGIVKQSKGHIWVYSELGVGTTFKVYWPIADQALAELEDDPVFEVMSPGDETILLVEDNEQLRELAQHILQSNGYQVLTANSGEVALEICRNQTEPIDLLLTDVLMVGMNGRQLMEAVKQIFSNIRVLYMSGYTDDVIVKHGVLEKEIVFLQKPFAPNHLLRKVRQVLNQPKIYGEENE